MCPKISLHLDIDMYSHNHNLFIALPVVGTESPSAVADLHAVVTIAQVSADRRDRTALCRPGTARVGRCSSQDKTALPSRHHLFTLVQIIFLFATAFNPSALLSSSRSRHLQPAMKLQQFLLGLGATAITDKSHDSVAPALWDGKCFYPQADSSFKLETYPGRWYQLAGTLARFTAGCKCISARYDINVSGKLGVTITRSSH